MSNILSMIFHTKEPIHIFTLSHSWKRSISYIYFTAAVCSSYFLKNKLFFNVKVHRSVRKERNILKSLLFNFIITFNSRRSPFLIKYEINNKRAFKDNNFRHRDGLSSFFLSFFCWCVDCLEYKTKSLAGKAQILSCYFLNWSWLGMWFGFQLVTFYV